MSWECRTDKYQKHAKSGKLIDLCFVSEGHPCNTVSWLRWETFFPWSGTYSPLQCSGAVYRLQFLMAEAQRKTFNIVSWHLDGSAAAWKTPFFFNCRRPCCCRPAGGRSPITPKVERGRWGAWDSRQGPAWHTGSCVHLQALLSSRAHQSIAAWSLLQSPCAHTPPGLGWSVGLVQIHLHSTLRLHCIGFSAAFPQPAPWGCLVLLFLNIPTLHRRALARKLWSELARFKLSQF